MAPSSDTSDPKRIQAVQTSLAILEALKENQTAGVTEIAHAIGVTKGTAYNHLATLREEGYVVKTEADEYQLGLKFADLAYHAKARVPILSLARAEVEKLGEKSGEMALFTVEEHGLGVCLHVAYGEDAVTTPLHVGYRNTLHHTAVGKAILAHLPEEDVREIIDRRGLRQVTEHTITDEETLFEELADVRRRGIAFNEEETMHGLVGVGAPVIDQEGEVLGALSVIGPRSRFDEERFRQELPDMITRHVNIIEINLTSL